MRKNEVLWGECIAGSLKVQDLFFVYVIFFEVLWGECIAGSLNVKNFDEQKSKFGEIIITKRD